MFLLSTLLDGGLCREWGSGGGVSFLLRGELGLVVSNTDKRVVICACGCVFHRPCLMEACAESGEVEEECPFC